VFVNFNHYDFHILFEAIAFRSLLIYNIHCKFFLFFGHFANRKFGGIFILLLVSKVGRYPGRSFAFYHTTYLKQHLRTSSESYWVTK
jgi:hypothetical protein